MAVFSLNQSTLGLSLFCLIYFVTLVIVNWNKCLNLYNIQYVDTDKSCRSFLLFLFLFSICCFVSGDFFHYKMMVENYDFTLGAINHGEKIYGVIIKLVDKNYFAFRTIVWGGAILIFRKVIKNYDNDIYTSLFFFCCTFFLTFANARASLAMSIYFLGVSIISANQGILKRIIGFLLIGSSYYFHNSMMIAIFMTLICFIPFNKKSVTITFLLSPVLFLAFSRFVPFIMNDNSLFAEEELLSKYEFYSERETALANWRGVLYEWFGYACFLIPFVIVTYKFFYSSIKTTVPSAILNLYKITFGLIITAFLFYNLDIQGKIFFYRILFMSFIPLTILIGYLFKENLISNIDYKRLVLFGVMCQLYKYLYSVYLCL